jgi:Amt family ammonium transporter
MMAPAATVVVWTLLDLMRLGRVTAVGCATAIVVGLVAITPAAGFVGPQGALILGAVAAVPSYFCLIWRAKTSLDDSLDVLAAHGVGGTVGALLTGVLADSRFNGTVDGAFYGNGGQVVTQVIAVAAAIAYSGIASFILLKVIGAVIPLRPSAEDETAGLDITMHGEEAYMHAEGSSR